uniref:Uncharacterized protein n=1 Tax=viral metagenome TaxID=1070528 RepID=A0A6H2A0B1_9ZZZZ
MIDKWIKLRKQERNKLIIAYINEHPLSPLSEVADIFKVSKQRISVIYKRYGGGKPWII